MPTTRPHTISSTDTSTTYGSTLAVSNSGVVNYLNKFGDTITGNVGYKQYDAAHLYYAALRYFRNTAITPPLPVHSAPIPAGKVASRPLPTGMIPS
jgi:type IV pilus assembly protein PilY1